MKFLCDNPACSSHCELVNDPQQGWRFAGGFQMPLIREQLRYFQPESKTNYCQTCRVIYDKLPKPDPMLEMARACSITLSLVPQRMWAELFVELKMSFYRRFSRGLICSTTHGLDYFDNVAAACEGTLHWDEKGEYGDNFRKLIAGRPRT